MSLELVPKVNWRFLWLERSGVKLGGARKELAESFTGAAGTDWEDEGFLESLCDVHAVGWAENEGINLWADFD